MSADWDEVMPSIWRTPNPALDYTEVDTIAKQVIQFGSPAIQRLSEVVMDSARDEDERYRAMAWLATLYSHFNDEAGKSEIVNALKSVVNGTLTEGRSWPRRDALKALTQVDADASQDTTRVDDYLVALAGKTGLSPAATNDILVALAETGSPKAIGPFAREILHSEDANLRNYLAGCVAKVHGFDWKDKLRTFLEAIETDSSINEGSVDARYVIQSLMPSSGEDVARRMNAVGDFIIEASRSYQDQRIIAVFAKLLIASVGGSQELAGHKINAFQSHQNIPLAKLKHLRVAVGGAPALSGLAQSEDSSDFPSWTFKVGLVFGALTFVLFIFLVGMGLFFDIPRAARLPIVAVLAIGLGFGFALLGGDAAAKGKLPFPGLKEKSFEFSVTGGAAVFVIVMVLGLLLANELN